MRFADYNSVVSAQKRKPQRWMCLILNVYALFFDLKRLTQLLKKHQAEYMFSEAQ